jgi:fatty-acyl-CoA synthase
MISEREFIDSMERASSEVGGLRLAIATDIESGGGIFNYEDFLASGNSSALERAVGAGDDAGIVYTSGTTSLPKGAVLTHGNYLADHANVGTFAELDATSVNLQMSPLYHASCIHTFMHVTYGGRTVLMGKFEPGPALKLLQDEKITYAFMVPTMIYAWLDFPDLANYDIGALRTIDYGAAPMSEVRLHEALRTFGYIFIHAYGMTETSSHASLLGKMEQTIAPGSVGRGLIHSEIRIVDNNGAPCAPGEIGEIVIRGPHVMSRYWRRPEATAETLVDGWLHSGDLGRTDANGYVYVVDRKRDMIISGGVNLYPRDIEEVIAAHPGVGEVAVFGIPDEKWGESIAACIVLRKGATATADDIVRFAGERIARFKIPKLIEFVSELPKNPSGKVLKRVLQDRHKTAMAV